MGVAFLDRDGTLIEERNYLNNPAEVILFPDTAKALLLLKEKGYRIFVVSNQSGLGRGLITPQQLDAVHQRFVSLLNESGSGIDGYFYCLHTPSDKCTCRKPGISGIPKVLLDKPVDFSQSLVAGDKLCDVELGWNLGARSYLVKTGYGEDTLKEMSASTAPYEAVKDIYEVAKRAAVVRA